MNDAIYTPPVSYPDPLPGQLIQTQTPVYQNLGSDTYSTPVTPPTPLPEIIIASQIMSDAFNTQTQQILGSFTFGVLGSIQIGTYTPGVSGDVRITPNGITARDVNGNTTFTLDGTTGNATFKGTIQAGTVISGAANVGNSNVVIDGANSRILINDGTTNRVIIGFQSGGF